MKHDWVVPWKLLGLAEGDPAPARVRVRLLAEAELEAMVCGAVREGGTFEVDPDGFAAPVRLGLFDEDTFGVLPRLPGGGVDLAAFEHERFTRRPQLREPGDLPLEALVLNPWVRRFALDRVAAQCALSEDEVRSVLEGRAAIDDGGALVPLPRFDEEGETSLSFGVEGLDLRADRLEGVLPLLPVLPAGLRGAAWSRAGGLTVHGLNLRYDKVLEANEALARGLDEGSHARLLAAATADLQRAVDALFFGDEEELSFLSRPLQGEYAQHALEVLRAVTDRDSFVLALRGELFGWRSYLETSGLHAELLDASGAVDVEFETSRARDVAAGTFEAICERVLGPLRHPGPSVMHGPIDGHVPHVDVYAFEGEGLSTWCVSGGMSTREMNGAASASLPHAAPAEVRLCIELACELGPCSSVEREAVQGALLQLALYPFRANTWIAPRQDVRIGGPLVPGSQLVAWALFELSEPWSRRACIALPRHPRLLRVVPITEGELEFKRRHGALALWERLHAAGAEVARLDRGPVDLT